MIHSKELSHYGILLSLLCCMITLTCGTNRVEQAHILEEKPVYGGTFRTAQLTPETLDPIFIDDIYESTITNQIFDGLLAFNEDLRPVPAIAQEWIISLDRRTYTFTLQKGVTFHNGREVTAEDCVYSLTRIFDPSLPASGIARDYLNEIVGAEEYLLRTSTEITGLKALDRYSLEIVLTKPSPTFLTVLAMDNIKIVPKEVIMKNGDQWFGEHPIGTGPFRFLSWTKHQQIALAAYHQYFRGRPYLDSVKFEVPLNYEEEEFVKKFLGGSLETIAVPIAELDRFRGGKNYTIIKRPELSFEFIGCNVQRPPLDNVKVRRAIAHALNRERMINLDPESFISPSGILPPGMLGFSPAQKILPYDPAKAKQLLAESGLAKEAQTLRLEYWGVGTDTQTVYKSDSMVQEDLALIGIDLDVRYEDWLNFDQRITEGKAQLFSMSLIADIPDPVSFLYSIFHSKSEANMFYYHNTKVDSILEKAREELNSFQRVRMCQQAEQIILKDVPLVPLDHIVNIFAFQPYIRGIELSPFGMADISMEKIWMAPDETASKQSIPQ